MDWTKLLKAEIEDAYGATNTLLGFVDDGTLDWKPASGENWMTTGQLLKHLETACGFCCQGFVTGGWGRPPEGAGGGSGESGGASPESMLPPAEKMPAAASVDEARRALAADRELALRMVDDAGEDRLNSESTVAPWDPRPVPLGQRLLQMVGHLAQHKAQLFYYLKLQGKPVNTMHLYGAG